MPRSLVLVGEIGACGGGAQREEALPCSGAPVQQQWRVCGSPHDVAGLLLLRALFIVQREMCLLQGLVAAGCCTWVLKLCTWITCNHEWQRAGAPNKGWRQPQICAAATCGQVLRVQCAAQDEHYNCALYGRCRHVTHCQQSAYVMSPAAQESCSRRQGHEMSQALSLHGAQPF